MAKVTIEEQLRMWQELRTIQEAFPYTEDGLLSFADHCIHELIPGNPRLNPKQADILCYMFNGPQYRMVEAQRG